MSRSWLCDAACHLSFDVIARWRALAATMHLDVRSEYVPCNARLEVTSLREENRTIGKYDRFTTLPGKLARNTRVRVIPTCRTKTSHTHARVVPEAL